MKSIPRVLTLPMRPFLINLDGHAVTDHTQSCLDCCNYAMTISYDRSLLITLDGQCWHGSYTLFSMLAWSLPGTFSNNRRQPSYHLLYHWVSNVQAWLLTLASHFVTENKNIPARRREHQHNSWRINGGMYSSNLCVAVIIFMATVIHYIFCKYLWFGLQVV
jgi:hypothetical protein